MPYFFSSYASHCKTISKMFSLSKNMHMGHCSYKVVKIRTPIPLLLGRLLITSTTDNMFNWLNITITWISFFITLSSINVCKVNNFWCNSSYLVEGPFIYYVRVFWGFSWPPTLVREKEKYLAFLNKYNAGFLKTIYPPWIK